MGQVQTEGVLFNFRHIEIMDRRGAVAVNSKIKVSEFNMNILSVNGRRNKIVTVSHFLDVFHHRKQSLSWPFRIVCPLKQVYSLVLPLERLVELF